MVYSSDIGLVNNFKLSDFDNMKPWQREVYIQLISERFKERIELLKKNSKK